MAHELEMTNDGKALMFYVKSGGTPWHELGTGVSEAPDTETGIKLAGLDWTVSLHDMYSNVNGQRIKAINRMVVRDSDNKYLSEVGPKWHPLQNADAFKWFDPFIEAGQASLETAGSLFGGSRIWVLAKLNHKPIEIVPGDEVNNYILLANSHNDRQSASISLTNVRTVCNNTLTAALRDTATKTLRSKHTAKLHSNLDAIREVINTVNAEFEATAEQYRELARRQINQKDLVKYVKTVFRQEEEVEIPEEFAPPADFVDNDQRKIENKIIPLFEGAVGNDLPGVKGTWWAALNAITFHLTWQRGRSVDNRLDNLWFGDSAKVNKRALAEALKMSV